MGNQIQKEFQQKTEPVRLNKYLSEAGVCSRREADRLIASGRVTVDGRPGETGMKVCPGQKVCIGKKVVSRQEEMVLLAVNKPVGMVVHPAPGHPDGTLVNVFRAGQGPTFSFWILKCPRSQTDSVKQNPSIRCRAFPGTAWSWHGVSGTRTHFCSPSSFL